ncbi:nuclear transport factor 2 family protein [uncultured Pelagimonas sp.]|uniref:nuclear transport factor 2 family protein n=1 Tax=uncultured Pelagimonas sp. TaxID=1618102 RepID=UPI00262E9341|nr:nuclear transport factor 2 family protein [uncultured Pelagimonas sp.]
MERPDLDAKHLVQTILETTGEALMEGCFATFSACFTLPQIIETFEKKRVVTSYTEWKGIFDDVRSYHRQLGVTQLVRTCLEVKVLSDEELRCTHETRLMNGNQLLSRPFPVLSNMRRLDDGWKVTGSSYAIPDSLGYTRALTGPPDKE